MTTEVCSEVGTESGNGAGVTQAGANQDNVQVQQA